MNVYIASDHAGFIKKNELRDLLAKKYDIVDLGPDELNPEDDYPVYAERVGEAVISEPGSFGILVCRSAQGMEIAVNKIDGIRAALVWNKHIAFETRQDNDSNVLTLPSGELSLSEMHEITSTFLSTSFSGKKRHKRRIEEIKEIEEEQ